jgi:hypothetical protein
MGVVVCVPGHGYERREWYNTSQGFATGENPHGRQTWQAWAGASRLATRAIPGICAGSRPFRKAVLLSLNAELKRYVDVLGMVIDALGWARRGSEQWKLTLSLLPTPSGVRAYSLSGKQTPISQPFYWAG